MRKRVLPLALALALCLGLAVPAMAVTTEVKTAEELKDALTKGGDIVLGSDIGVKETLTVTASASLDLNGHKLTVTPSGWTDLGIVIDLAQTLTVLDSQYSRFEPGNGQLKVSAGGTGIMTSGATLIINSGVVEAEGQWYTGIGGTDKNGYRDGGTVIINGGIVTATGGAPGIYGGAGIGGMGENGNGGTVTINGGTVKAIGGNYGAGIGGGGKAGNGGRGSGGTITINGGIVSARGNNSNYHYAADIGAGNGGGDDNITVLKINGGTVELLNSGIDAKKLILKSCTITGNGAGDYKGSYDASGNLVIVEGASDWASDSVAEAVAKGLVPQNLQADYDRPATRAEFCALATACYEAVTGTEIAQRKTFSDTSDPSIEKMGAMGVVSGVGDGSFDPDGTLTREQAAAMLARLAEAMGEPLPEQMATFSDRASISAWAVAQVGQVQGVGIMGGVGDNRFDPAGNYTVEQSIITMLRLYKAVTQA